MKSEDEGKKEERVPEEKKPGEKPAEAATPAKTDWSRPDVVVLEDDGEY